MLNSDFWLKDVFLPWWYLLCALVTSNGWIENLRKQSLPRKGEGLRITAKRKKESVNERTVHLFVTIAYGKGVAKCEQFLGKYNGDNYSKFVRKYFPATFVKANNNDSKLLLKDGDPAQNCKELHKSYSKIVAE